MAVGGVDYRVGGAKGRAGLEGRGQDAKVEAGGGALREGAGFGRAAHAR